MKGPTEDNCDRYSGRPAAFQGSDTVRAVSNWHLHSAITKYVMGNAGPICAIPVLHKQVI